MTITCESCLVDFLPPADVQPERALPAPAAAVPEGAAAGLAALFTDWLGRLGGGAPMAADALRFSLALWLGAQWIGELRLDADAPIRQTGEANTANHLLFRLLEAAAQSRGLAVPTALAHAFDDLRAGTPLALLTYFSALGQTGERRRRALIRAFELDPGFVAPRLALAEERLAAGDGAAAAALLAGVTVNDPERARELGLACWEHGEAGLAAELLGVAVSRNPDDGLAHAALAALLARQGAAQEALLLAARATSLIADDYRSWSALGDAHRALGDPRQAAFYYNAALRLAPEAPHLLKDAAASHIAAQRPREALVLIERALALAPDDPENHAQLALARRDLGDYAGALAAAGRAQALAPADLRFAELAGEIAKAAQ